MRQLVTNAEVAAGERCCVGAEDNPTYGEEGTGTNTSTGGIDGEGTPADPGQDAEGGFGY